MKKVRVRQGKVRTYLTYLLVVGVLSFAIHDIIRFMDSQVEFIRKINMDASNIFAETTATTTGDDHRHMMTTTPPTTLFGKRHICPAATSLLNLDDPMILRTAYEKAEEFHNVGGNLKSIEQYLNSHMDDTLDRLKMKFYTHGSTEPVAGTGSVTQKIIELQRQNDKNKRGGYDQRSLPGMFKDANNKQVKGDFRVDVMEPWNGERWDVGLGPIATNACRSVDRIRGDKGYDDKFMCSYHDMMMKKSSSKNQTDEEKKQCNMLSIGSDKTWGFEETVVKNTNCTTHTYDCTTALDPRKPPHDDIHYYPYCISHENKQIGDWTYATYGKIVEAAGLTETPTLFKMDVEGFEFDVLSQMLREAKTNDAMDMLPVQISVELHYATRMFDVAWKMRMITAAEISTFMGMMYNGGGYIPVKHEAIGPGCYPCAEMLFVRVFCD